MTDDRISTAEAAKLEGVPMTDDRISTAEAAKLEGVSEVMMLKWRRKGVGPTAYPARAGARAGTRGNYRKFEYSRREVIAHRRSRMTLEERVAAVEAALDSFGVGAAAHV